MPCKLQLGEYNNIKCMYRCLEWAGGRCDGSKLFRSVDRDCTRIATQTRLHVLLRPCIPQLIKIQPGKWTTLPPPPPPPTRLNPKPHPSSTRLTTPPIHNHDCATPDTQTDSFTFTIPTSLSSRLTSQSCPFPWHKPWSKGQRRWPHSRAGSHRENPH